MKEELIPLAIYLSGVIATLLAMCIVVYRQCKERFKQGEQVQVTFSEILYGFIVIVMSWVGIAVLAAMWLQNHSEDVAFTIKSKKNSEDK